jgi:putative transposase
MEIYQRRLPHWQPEGAAIFLTWRLYGSLPGGKVVTEQGLSAGERFAAAGRTMDRATSGPMWLTDGRVAQAVVETLYRGRDVWKLYDLLAWAPMSNYVHILIQPHAPLATITRAVKKRSARIANEILERWGARFRQDESYDRWVRDSAELRRITRYIEWNPVKAKLVASPELWPWSSARQVWNLPHVRTF